MAKLKSHYISTFTFTPTATIYSILLQKATDSLNVDEILSKNSISVQAS